MSLDTSSDFNFGALALGIAILLLCLLVQLTIIHRAALGIKYLQRKKWYLAGLAGDQLTFLAGAIVLLFAHLVHIYIWGYSLYLMGIIQVFKTAVLFAGSTYTTVGFASDPLTGKWQLLTVVMATSGLFSFGLSTSIMFLLSQKVFIRLGSLRSDFTGAAHKET